MFKVRYIQKRIVKAATRVVLLCTPFVAAPFAQAEEQLPTEFQGVTVREKLGSRIDVNAQFVDHNGKSVLIGDLLKDGKPLLLTMNYYRCKMLCSLQINAIVDGLRGLGWTLGKRFNMITVSIDPRSQTAEAVEKRTQYLNALGQKDSSWTFLTGDQQNITSLSNSIGFEYKYMPETDEYVHGLAIFFVSPKGELTRYLYGLTYKPLDIKLALMDAADGIIATPVERFIMNCFAYDSKHGRYTASIMNIMRMGCLLTIAVLGSSLAFMWRREKVRKREESVTCS